MFNIKIIRNQQGLGRVFEVKSQITHLRANPRDAAEKNVCLRLPLCN